MDLGGYKWAICSYFIIVYPTGLLYNMMHAINILNPKAMKFGRIVSG